ncbi:hypothetical protein MLD38_000371 [Melastoma candidum]|uniref:Uncharacterized protein n=1 Tax=Melastoma candidum TaxID=119954 RepID=A0ACB9SB51_9MYRT|nr:hypothetical protein MLD38_000371 [Melastoma candidum]
MEEELTEEETALYDRQIRVWGADAQRRLSKASILVCGITGTLAENVVLAGVGCVTLVDDRSPTEDALSANFLVPPSLELHGNKTLAQLCGDSLKDFNPMVRVSFQNGDPSSFSAEFFSKFDAVVVSGCTLSAKKSINEKCRKSLRRISFYSVDCRNSCGEIFVDLQDYKYTKKKLDEAVEVELQYPSFQDAVAVPWRKLPRKVSKLYFAMRVLEKFEELEGRNPRDVSIADLPGVLKLKRELCDAESLNESHVPNSLLERLLAGTREFPPVCAIVGGFLGQEVIKGISGKGDPLKNFFFFDASDGKGVIEDISSIS